MDLANLNAFGQQLPKCLKENGVQQVDTSY